MKSAAIRRMKTSPSILFGLILLIVSVTLVNLYLGYHATANHHSLATPEYSDNANNPPRHSKNHPHPMIADLTQKDNNNSDDDDDESAYSNPNSLQALRTIPSQRRNPPTQQACHNTLGVYHIQMGDIGGAAGTIFFQFVVSQILYAEQYNLTPWVHLNNVSHIVYDPVVHEANRSRYIVLNPPMQAQNATYVRHRQGGHRKDFSPGPPDTAHSYPIHQLHLTGTGVWGHYFEPVSSYIPGDTSCHTYVTMDLFLITPGLHGFTDYAPRCWRYHYLPDYVTHMHMPFQEWIAPQRATAARVVQQYIHLRPPIRHAASVVNPPATSLLGLHIRHSDKAAGRRVLETAEFLPYVLAFAQQQRYMNNNEDWAIYLATDSDLVVQEIQQQWPSYVTDRIRTFQAIRSTNTTAVFDMPQHNHHQTNTEVLIEIQALSQCHYLLHGLSAVSESALWLNSQLVSVDLEDPKERLTVAQFRTLLQMRNQSSALWPVRVRTDVWWTPGDDEKDDATRKIDVIDDPARTCSDYQGIFLIHDAGGHGFGKTFFTMILNQLQYAAKYHLLPWVHLNPRRNPLVYDPEYHAADNQTISVVSTRVVTVQQDASGLDYPGPPGERIQSMSYTHILQGSGIWNSYFESLHPSKACQSQLPFIELESSLVTGMELYDPASIRAWRYDDVTSWSVEALPEQRQRAHAILQKFFRPLPYLQRRVDRVFAPTARSPCLGVHIRSIDKQGKFRKKVSLEKYLEYIRAFAEAGGECTYLATDSRSALNFLYKTLESENVTSSIQLLHQGNQVVRSSKGRNREWLPHYYASHHRVNAETLVDVLALARCQYLLHGSSTVSEAALYWNPNITSIPLEDSSTALSPEEWSRVVRLDMEEHQKKNPQHETSTIVTETTMDNTTIIRTAGSCQNKNAIVYLAQKTHSSYAGRDSYASLLESIRLLKKHYLDAHDGTVDVFVFHSGDFTEKDWNVLQDAMELQGILHLVDLTNSSYWSRPIHHVKDNPADWFAWPLFSEGYRRMMHWFAIDIWNYFTQLNQQQGCQYRYLWRLDEDSFIHSPIRYDIFDFMASRQFVYGFRMCAYEMKVTQRMWTMWRKRHPEFEPRRKIELEMCGIYNNFFVADLEFFQRPDVAQFLDFIDRQGHIYRRRLGDLMIHSMAVYAFALPQQIHRFLDFTYEHGTVNHTDGCLVWGGIQAGYNDDHSVETVSRFYDRFANCSGVRASYMGSSDLSSSYAHLPVLMREQMALFTVTAGEVELPAGKGTLSG